MSMPIKYIIYSICITALLQNIALAEGQESVTTMQLSHSFEIVPINHKKISIRYKSLDWTNTVDPSAENSLQPKTKEIQMMSTKLSAIPPNMLHGFSKLIVLRLNDNLLVSLHKDAFINSRKMRLLHLQFNQLKEIERGTFDKNTQIYELYLNNNKLTKLDRNVFLALKNMITLNLNYNQLNMLHQGMFRTMYRLKYLFISNNLIKTLDNNFEGLGALYVLSAERNKIKTIEPGTFDGLFTLHTLRLHRQNLITLNEDLFKDNDNLKFLTLAHNKIRRVLPGIFPNLVNLYKLDLFANPMKITDPTPYNTLDKMKHFMLPYWIGNREYKEIRKKRLKMSNEEYVAFYVKKAEEEQAARRREKT